MTAGIWKQLICIIVLTATTPLFAQQAKLYTTRVFQWSIPYTLETSTDTITLYVSTNQGQKWKVVSQQNNNQDSFRFKAPREGEYWFCSRTNQDSRVIPTGLKPQQRIFVDVQRPGIELRTHLTTAGEIVLDCKVTDLTVIDNQVAAEIQTAPGLPWQPFPLSGPPELVSDGVVQLSGRWQPDQQTRVAMIRIKALDGAENLSIAERRIYFPPPTLHRPQAYQPVENPYTRPLPHEGAKNWSPDTGAQSIPGQRTDLPDSADTHPPNRETNDFSISTAKPIVNGPGIDAVIHHINRDRFRLNYALSDTGSETGQVQLWATEDGGKTWGLWGIDQDRQSPLDVEIQRDGLVGFVTVVGEQDGSSKDQPTSSSNADIWVKIDRVKPVLRLGNIQRSMESGFPEILIKWEATDDNFSGRPIRLHYSQSQQGPWKEISDSVPNAGFYRWRIDPNATGNWFIQVAAVDRANNRSAVIAAEPAE